MPALFCSGFEAQAIAAEWGTIAGAPTIDTVTYHIPGKASMRCNTGAAASCRAPGNTYTTRMSFWIYIRTAPSALCCIAGGTGTSDQIRLTTARYLTVYGAGSLIGTGTHQIPLNTWTRISIGGDGTNHLKIYVDGVLDIDAQDAIMMYGYVGENLGVQTAVTADMNFDDVYCDLANVTDMSDIGDIRVVITKPYDAGDLTQYTPSAGSNWDCVDEVPYSEADYVRKGGAAATYCDLYKIQPYGSIGIITTGSIALLRLSYRAMRGGSATTGIAYKDAGSLGRFQAVVNTAASMYHALFATMPMGGGRWNWDRVGSLQIGAMRGAGTHSVFAVFANIAYWYVAPPVTGTPTGNIMDFAFCF